MTDSIKDFYDKLDAKPQSTRTLLQQERDAEMAQQRALAAYREREGFVEVGPGLWKRTRGHTLPTQAHRGS